MFAFDVATSVCPSRTGATTSRAADGGCRVTERTWDRRPGWFSKTAWVGTGVRDRDAANAEHIKLTLQRLKEKAEAG